MGTSTCSFGKLIYLFPAVFFAVVGLARAESAIGPQGHDATPDAGLGPEARAQIDRVIAATAELRTPDQARAAGYRPSFGFSPTMGVHWTNRRLLRDGEVDLERPDVLMFMPLDGRETLVGVAYGVWQEKGAPPPQGFSGEHDEWHTHDFPLRRGNELAMVHLWFVESPDGPFGNHNPSLPFRALGIEVPEAARFRDPLEGDRLRTLSLALGEAIRPLAVDGTARLFTLGRSRRRAEPHRDAIRELVPALRAAAAERHGARFDAVAGTIIGHWGEIEAIYLESMPTERARQRLLDALTRMKGSTSHAH